MKMEEERGRGNAYIQTERKTKMKTKYITTTLPYANSKAHVGHAFEFILGDALSRMNKTLLGEKNVLFNIGLDEHGQKIQDEASKAGISPQAFIERQRIDWQIFAKAFDVEYDSFYCTATEDHNTKVKIFWEKVSKSIYKKPYKGKYCVGCESFKSDKDLVDGKCVDHPSSVIKEVEEENYFFRITDEVKSSVKKMIDSGFIFPRSKSEELRNIVDESEDISVSRIKKNLSWGVGVPGDDEHTVYVWFDALCNYVFAAGLCSDAEKFDKFWNNAEILQICGPDNIRFQGLVFQSMLIAARLKNTDKLLVHGTILDEHGRKMSKTTGNVVDPMEQLTKYGKDAVRYYMLAGLHTTSNSAWSEANLIDLYNSDLADGFGNLIARATHLIDQKNPEIVPPSSEFKLFVDESTARISLLWNELEVKHAFESTKELVTYGNQYFTKHEPWKEREGWNQVLSDVLYLLNCANNLYYPAIPNKHEAIKTSLSTFKKEIFFPKIK